MRIVRRGTAGAGESGASTGGIGIGKALAIVVAIVSLFGAGLGAVPSRDTVEIPDDPLTGRVLFESKHCVRCHGVGGDSRGIGPELWEGRFGGTFLDLGAAMWNHVPGMSVSFEVAELDWPTLSDRQVTDLLVFLYFIDYLGRPGEVAAGRQVFEDGGCASCHVVGGGEARVGPDLAELGRYASPLYVAREIWNHGPAMLAAMRRRQVGPPTFRDGDLADLSAYLRQVAGPGPREPALAAPGNPNRGGELFASKGCGACHGRDGRGGVGGPDLAAFELRRSAAAIAGTMWNHALEMSDAMEARGIGWPEFAASELADLTAFIYFLPFSDPSGDPGRGAGVFTERSCAACHAEGEGREEPGSVAGPDLAADEVTTSPASLVAAMWNHGPLMRRAILGEGRPWPELSGDDLRDLRAYLNE